MIVARVWRVLPGWVVAYACVVMAFAAAVLLSPLSGTTFGAYADDVGDLVVAGVAAGCCGWRAFTSPSGRARRMWGFLAAACGSWALGESVWCWYQLGRGLDPFPSPADVGYLGFPVAACVALLLCPTVDGSIGGGRRFLDTGMTIGAMALISWETVLSAVAKTGLTSSASDVLSVTYPLSDLAVLTLTILTLTRARGNRVTLGFVAAGLASLCLSDSLFSYLTATSAYNGGAVDLGWFLAFVLLACAPLIRGSSGDDGSGRESNTSASKPSRLAYAPFLGAVVVTVALAATGRRPTGGQLLLVTAIVSLLLIRQYLTTAENSRLAVSLGHREDELRHQAFHDSLTGLPNRALFRDRLEHALALHARDLRQVSVLFLDLDDFKIINDTLGHAAGDELLTRVADRLLGAVRNGDTIARLGGDEFAVLIEDHGDAAIVADKITDAIHHPFVFSGTGTRSVTTSIGVVVLEAGDASTTADTLVTRADTAMYAAKRAGKGQIAWYQPGMSLREVTDHSLATALAHAIDHSGIELAYQPIVNLQTGQTVAFEALARWNHGGRAVPPDVFIPLAEQLGLIRQLTEHVLESASAQLQTWSARTDDQTLMVSVNVPPTLITTPGFLAMVTRVLDRHHLRPGQLVLELTESGLFRDIAAARLVLNELHRLGVSIWLDDFGVGYSSLAQLHDIEFDLIKLDKEFVRHLQNDPRQTSFVRGLLHLSADIGTTVLAEGIENVEQLEHLQQLGCALGQGYLFARPMPADHVRGYLATQRPQAQLTRGAID